ncbi:response regulator transcription factor [Kistimonas asteriae]|uniref:response regulator transcription factor n=1 Tax=Kistimonas asteriae TaxID=517724 RepID=UPI001BAC2FE7|nr:response regulator transcription factor [Kistimonas asteriae]
MNTEADNALILLVDDDVTFHQVLARSLRRKGFEVIVADGVDNAHSLLTRYQPDYAVVDLKMEGASGLALIPALQTLAPDCKTVVLTGYASIATAVEAMRLGAVDYLCKPADTTQILAALQGKAPNPSLSPAEQPMSVDRVEWEHIQKVLYEHEGNISATARSLGMHRRTLQRKLAKRPAQA